MMFRKLYNKTKAFRDWMRYDGRITQVIVSPISYPNSLYGKKVIITGGSDGIGLATARKMLESGARVVITGRNSEKLEKRRKEINDNNLNICQWDVSDIGSINKSLKGCIEILGGVDVFVNNAGHLEHYRSDEDYFDITLTTNLKAVHYICLELIDYWIHEKNDNNSIRKIINVSSMNAYQGAAHPYYYSKRAMSSLTEGLAKKYARENIIVNAVAPGICASSINYKDVKENAYYGGNPIRRVIVPEEIAGLIHFLATDAANGIVGQTIVCDGGETIK